VTWENLGQSKISGNKNNINTAIPRSTLIFASNEVFQIDVFRAIPRKVSGTDPLSDQPA
jgi:hypothetical protein